MAAIKKIHDDRADVRPVDGLAVRKLSCQMSSEPESMSYNYTAKMVPRHREASENNLRINLPSLAPMTPSATRHCHNAFTAWTPSCKQQQIRQNTQKHFLAKMQRVRKVSVDLEAVQNSDSSPQQRGIRTRNTMPEQRRHFFPAPE